MSQPPVSSVPTLGPYEVLAKLATGGVGELLLGRQRGPKEGGSPLVVLKRALPHLAHESAVREGLLSEARWTKATQHPNVVRYIDLVAPRGELLLVLEYVHGTSLAYLLDAHARAGAPAPAGVVLRVLLDALSGLAALHTTPGGPLVHGDLNPRNILVGLDGVTKLCDLGLAAPERASVRPEFRGTAAYTAPEVWQGVEQTRRSDVFSAGVVLWEALRGQRLFRGQGLVATLNNIVEAPIPPLDLDRPDLLPYAPAVRRALLRSPEGRFPSAVELRAELEGLGGASPRSDVSALLRKLAGDALDQRLLALAP